MADSFFSPQAGRAHTFCIAQKVCKNARQNNARLNGRAGFCPLAIAIEVLLLSELLSFHGSVKLFSVSNSCSGVIPFIVLEILPLLNLF